MLVLFLLLGFALAQDSVVRYDGYRVLEVEPLRTDSNAQLVNNLIDQDQRLKEVILLEDFVSKTTPVSLVVSPNAFRKVQKIFNERGIRFAVVNDNLQASLDENKRINEERLAAIAKTFHDDPSQFNHTAYLPFDDQILWIENAAERSPIASIFEIGSSYEGRRIKGIAINAGVGPLPAIWIDANIHAREWITSSSILYFIDWTLFSDSADADYLRRNYRIYILPNLNPDGYEHSRLEDRMWRKTRSPNNGSLCVGTDPNRNWDSSWGGEGSGALACSDTYRGAFPFSEPETLAASNYIEALSSSCNVMISVHSYSQLWLIPWGSTREHPEDYDELMRVGLASAAAIKAVNGLDFVVGTPPDILYVASGGSFDWAKEKVGIKYASSPELRPATAGQGGFIIPPTNIIPSGRELSAAILATAREARHEKI